MKDNYKVYLVEDEAPIRRNICSKIDMCKLPFDVVGVFKNGRQALDSIPNIKPDVIITDIKMPIMDGLSLAENVHSNYPDILVAIISGYNDFEYARDAIKFRVTDYLTKPVDIDELNNLLLELKQRLDENNPDINREAETILKSRHSHGFLESIKEYIHIHFKENITVTDIAIEFSCNQEYLTRLFKKNTGNSLLHYIISLKIKEAKKVLRNYDDIDIQSVGEIVGYADPYYFSRIFKKYTLMTPSGYRKQYKKH